ncbi:MAG TPA: hypothetical protein VGS13_15350 [Stellaceae bacterium]|nr:hypothetical protein [Stellaceae bacterium]
MITMSQEWAELEYLSAHIGKLYSRYQAARAMATISQCFGALKAIEREIAETAEMRDVLVSHLSDRVASHVIAASVTPAAANS